MVICQYFLQGKCRFGDRCRNDHVNNYSRGGSRGNYYENYDTPPKNRYDDRYTQSRDYSYDGRNQYDRSYGQREYDYEGPRGPYKWVSPQYNAKQEPHQQVPSRHDSSFSFKKESYSSPTKNQFSSLSDRFSSSQGNDFMAVDSYQHETPPSHNQAQGFFGNRFQTGGPSSTPLLFGKKASGFGSSSDNKAFSLSHLTRTNSIPSTQEDMTFETERSSSSSATTTSQAKASSFSFKLPSQDEKPSSDKQSNLYTAMSELTVEEMEAFNSDTFQPGKIPTKPPPMSLCF